MFPQDTDSEEVGNRLRNSGSNRRSRIEAWLIRTNRCLCDQVFTLPFWDVFFGKCRSVSKPRDLQAVRPWFENIWVDVESPLTISKCRRRIPNSNWIEFPSLHFLTCSCFCRRSLHHLKRCRTPNRRGTKKASDLVTVQILEAPWRNESWQVHASTASRSATKATNSTWNSRGGLISCEMGSWTAAYSTSPIIALCNSWFSTFSGQKTKVKSECPSCSELARLSKPLTFFQEKLRLQIEEMRREDRPTFCSFATQFYSWNSVSFTCRPTMHQLNT